MAQLTDVVSAVSQPGQHVGLYGERGVGKTSLANVLAEFFDTGGAGSHMRAVVINCVTDDSFATVWRNVFVELEQPLSTQDVRELSPEAVRRRLQALEEPALIVLDGLDRLEDDGALTALADTMKTLSDHAVASTLVLVGVARSIGELVGEHASVVRALVQIQMPRMSADELGEILAKGCAKAGLDADPAAIAEITTLSEGLPHYTHLLGLNAAQGAVQEDRATITPRGARTGMRCLPRFCWPAPWPRRTSSASSPPARSVSRSRSSLGDGWRSRPSRTI